VQSIVEPTKGAEVQDAVHRLLSTSPDVSAKIMDLIK
jgi:hypothetical protein